MARKKKEETVTIRTKEFNRMLVKAWSMGYITGEQKKEEATDEQWSDCLNIWREHFPKVKVSMEVMER